MNASEAAAAPHSTLLARIANALPGLRKSERDVAELALAEPARVLQLSIAEMAEQAGVSQPTVARFAAALGFSGFREFKLKLAQSIATGVPYVHSDVRPDDTPERIVPKVFDRAIGALIDVRNHLDASGVGRAVELLARARRIECFGLGNSAMVAHDAQHKLLRFGIPCGAYADSHSMGIAASVLGVGDVVLAVSASGRTVDLIENVRAAAAAGADVIAITGSHTPLAEAAGVVLHTDVPEDTDVYTPMTTRLAHLVVIDTLCVGLALALGTQSQERMERAKRSVLRRRIAKPPTE